MNTYYVNGEFVPEKNAVIPVNDLAILRGYGVFELVRTYEGIPFLLNEHLQRLEHSAHKIGLKLTWTKTELSDIVMETLRLNQHNESSIRIVVTGGSSPDFITPQGTPRLLVLVNAISPVPESWYCEGVKIITVKLDRPIPDAKSINYIPATIALKEARKQNAIEAVYVDRKGVIQEGTTSNIFAFMNGTLVTPSKGILSGITRSVVLELTQKKHQQRLRDISLKELQSADEVFITGTGKGVVPVVCIDDITIGNGVPGPLCLQLIKDLKRHIYEYVGRK